MKSSPDRKVRRWGLEDALHRTHRNLSGKEAVFSKERLTKYTVNMAFTQKYVLCPFARPYFYAICPQNTKNRDVVRRVRARRIKVCPRSLVLKKGRRGGGWVVIFRTS